jgi:hypothetical protein
MSLDRFLQLFFDFRQIGIHSVNCSHMPLDSLHQLHLTFGFHLELAGKAEIDTTECFYHLIHREEPYHPSIKILRRGMNEEWGTIRIKLGIRAREIGPHNLLG